MYAILDYAGSWFRWPLLCCLTVLPVFTFRMGSVEKLTRKFDMEKLLQENSRNFPALLPVVGRGKYLLSRESFDNGPWKLARSPLQFVVEHGILDGPNGFPCTPEDVLENGMASMEKPAYGHCVFKEERALAVLKKQLGEPFSDINSFSPVRKALAVALMLYALGRKQECIAILDDASASYSEKNGQPLCPILEAPAFQEEIQKPLSEWDSFLERKSIQCHSAFQLPLFMALLIEARKKGVLATSQFIWLRPLDRPLWYALNQCGGRAAWAEALAPWAHFQAEKQSGAALTEPQIEAGVASLRKALDAQGWLKSIYDPLSEPITILEPQTEETVTAPAEEDTE